MLLLGVLLGAFGIWWGQRTPGAGPLVILGVVLIVSTVIELVLRMRGWPGLYSLLQKRFSSPARPIRASLEEDGLADGPDESGQGQRRT